MARRIVTAEDVQSLPEGAVLDVPEDALLTDLAREWIARKKIQVVAAAAQTQGAPAPKARVALGADHRGYELKESLKPLLGELGASFIDYGTHSAEAVDYPDFAHAVAVGVALGHAELGIVVDGAGIGSAIAANKVPGIRAAPCGDEAAAANSREHNDANVLTLGAAALSPELAAKIVRVFLAAGPGEERHRGRVRKILEIERKYYRPV